MQIGTDMIGQARRDELNLKIIHLRDTKGFMCHTYVI